MTDAGARVIFCSYFEALTTVSTGISISCSRLRSARLERGGEEGVSAPRVAVRRAMNQPAIRTARWPPSAKVDGGRQIFIEIMCSGARRAGATARRGTDVSPVGRWADRRRERGPGRFHEWPYHHRLNRRWGQGSFWQKQRIYCGGAAAPRVESGASHAGAHKAEKRVEGECVGGRQAVPSPR